jgi:molecular chaperone GrpE
MNKNLNMETDKIEKIETEKEQDWKDSYVRLYADFENYKKRVLKEKEEIKNSTKLQSLNAILDLDNDLHIALKMIKDEKTLKDIQFISDKFKNFLNSQGIEEVPIDKYDDNLHEVISVINTGTEGIVSVVSKGYTLNGKIIKYPKVIISQ